MLCRRMFRALLEKRVQNGDAKLQRYKDRVDMIDFLHEPSSCVKQFWVGE